MFRFIRKPTKEAGLPPGTLIYTGTVEQIPVKITALEYTKDSWHEDAVSTIEDVAGVRDSGAVMWINVEGVHDTEVVRQLGEAFDVHPLVLEDIVSIGQRTKHQVFDSFLFVTMTTLQRDERVTLIAEQISLIIGSHYVLSFREGADDLFEPIRRRVQEGNDRIRQQGADYLAYALIDVIVDHYFDALEQIGVELESLEEEIMAEPSAEALHRLYQIRREILLIRKTIWPLREVISALQHDTVTLIKDSTRVYLHDVYDHTIHAVEIIDIYRELLTGIAELYHASLSNKMNNVIQLLTVIGTIFLPLTFIAGIYGMNFEVMPELLWRYGYPIILVVMVFVGVGLLLYFRKKKWL